MDAPEEDRGEDVGAVRLMSWATAAAIAVIVAGLASLSPAGTERLDNAMASIGGHPSGPMTRQQAEFERERRSLNEALRLFASDRDRLMTRVDSLERNLDDITGSIKSQAAARAQLESKPPEIAADDAAPAATEAPPKESGMPEWLANVPKPWPSASAGMEFAPGPQPSHLASPTRISALADAPGAPPVSRTDFGIDIGGGADLEEMRLLWGAAKARYGRQFGSLRPVVVQSEDRSGNPSYRLVIGPFANAGAAARLCATLGADTACTTRPFQGERLTP